MLLAPLTYPEAGIVRSVSISEQADEARERFSLQTATSALAWQQSFLVAGVEYPLTHELSGKFVLSSSGWQAFVPDLGLPFLGEGRSPDGAERDLMLQVHRRFQLLYRMRPFQMSSDERAVWRLLSSLIDIATYETNHPPEMRQVGKVGFIRRSRHGRGIDRLCVKWLNARSEDVRFDRAPPGFAGLRVDEWFEATTRRNPSTNELLDIISFQPIEPLPEWTVAEADAYWESLPLREGSPG